MGIVYFIGRLLFAALFVSGGYGHLTKAKSTAEYAKSMGVPAPEFMTILTGIMILVGGIFVIFNFELFYGALLIFLFLVPTAFMMHAFWKVQEPAMKAAQQAQFMKNIALAGAALMVMYFAYGTH
jgi:putative oxidoreductase